MRSAGPSRSWRAATRRSDVNAAVKGLMRGKVPAGGSVRQAPSAWAQCCFALRSPKIGILERSYGRISPVAASRYVQPPPQYMT